MLVDTTHFPIVWMRQAASSSETPADSPFADFEALLARKEAFVLLSDDGLDQDKHEHTKDEKKQISLWMKRHKVELRAFVKAAIYIEPSTAKRLAAKPFVAMYEKFWGYPMLLTATKDKALALAQKLLSDKAVHIQAL